MRIQLIDHACYLGTNPSYISIDHCHLWFVLFKSILIRRSQAGQQFPVRRVHVDTTQLDLSHKFELFVVKPPNDYNADETKYYQLKQLEHSPQDVEVILVKT